MSLRGLLEVVAHDAAHQHAGAEAEGRGQVLRSAQVRAYDDRA